jgi:hypothetical protein
MYEMMTAIMTGQNAMEVMRKREEVTRKLLETLRRMIIAAMKWRWTVQTIVFTREENALHTFEADGKTF